jgi:thiamine kinase-like enzyme
LRRVAEPEIPAPVRSRLDGVLRRLDCTAGRACAVTPLEGGLTNVNFRVDTGERVVVVRLSSLDQDLLSIDREAEYTNSRRAAESGAAPQVVEYLPGEGVLVIAWVEGRTYAPDDLRDADNLTRAAAACRTLHAGPRFDGDFDMFEIQQRYLGIVQERGFRLPDRYLEFQPAVERIRSALAVRAEATVPCNNDLLAANFIDDGVRLWIIDYEYAGNNEACFELGNIWSESTLDEEHLVHLVDAYYGEHRDDLVARARLLGLMSKYGWTLWASIQASASPMDFDFWSWGMEKYDRAVPEFDGPDFDALLDRAAGHRT